MTKVTYKKINKKSFKLFLNINDNTKQIKNYYW